MDNLNKGPISKLNIIIVDSDLERLSAVAGF